MTVRAHFRIAEVTGTIVWLVDLDDGAKSVTNDAEAVVAEVVAAHGEKRIIYKDSTGKWDELVHQNGRFTGFKTCYGVVPPSV